ncbi:hypothetical protein JHN59_08620 [Streptomyces sp. MBT49]|uniref:hypothetical protein n=1 Tax=unclassified Streptomyces TaxID=2593676 RepID=UPI00190B5F20|nr:MULTISPECIES: hypothetical protein [unclassified Streptomyces]MBK3624910.1 hypothetical protein [Streptomyces sp. MBT49]MBK3632554.1 hypothetical protein [Streptomyces sp. MBT97]
MAKTTSRTARKADDQDQADGPPLGDEPTADAPLPEPPEAGQEPDLGEDADTDGPQPSGVYEYVHGVSCTYPHVPLTCHPHQPAAPATDTAPEVPEQAATVYDWPDGPPDDGRWAATTKRPNQAADNCGGRLTSEE